jgi:hypothetical protein
MHIEITPDNLLIQLGYPLNDALRAQMERALNATKGFDTFSRHILSLKDDIAHLDGFIALSNSRDALKIKTNATRPEQIEEYRRILEKWSAKYKVVLEPVEGTATYYIVGLQ